MAETFISGVYISKKFIRGYISTLRLENVENGGSQKWNFTNPNRNHIVKSLETQNCMPKTELYGYRICLITLLEFI